MPRKLKYLLILIIFGLSFWILSGSISSSKEKATPTSVWSSFSSKEDKDQDGLKNEEEKKLGTDPENPDTDGDKILDGIEVKSGYDPLVKMSEDPKAATAGNKNGNGNVNGNVNSNANTNVNENKNMATAGAVLVNPATGQSASGGASTGEEKSSGESGLSNVNYTEQTLAKSDELVAKYKLHLKEFDKVDEDTKAKVEQEVADFIAQMLNKTGLDFAFSVPDNKISVYEGDLTLAAYLGQVKGILKKYGLVKENQNIEEGLREVVVSMSGMSRSDIDWAKVSLWKKDIPAAEAELSALTVTANIKPLHVRVLRIFGALNIVLRNMEDNDYFKAFVAAGRAEKVNEEIKKFVEEMEKIKSNK